MNHLVFFLALDEEDTMMPLVSEYWKAHQHDIDCCHCQLRVHSSYYFLPWCRANSSVFQCIKRYLLHLGTIMAGYSTEVMQNTVIHLESQGDGFLLQSLSSKVTSMPSPPPTICLDSPLIPHCSPHIWALKKAALTASAQCFSSSASSSPSSPLRCKQQAMLATPDTPCCIERPLPMLISNQSELHT